MSLFFVCFSNIHPHSPLLKDCLLVSFAVLQTQTILPFRFHMSLTGLKALTSPNLKRFPFHSPKND